MPDWSFEDEPTKRDLGIVVRPTFRGKVIITPWADMWPHFIIKFYFYCVKFQAGSFPSLQYQEIYQCRS